jgi:hypothetical protein
VIVSKLQTEHAVKVIFEKVKGHRANLVPFDNLTCPEQLNEMMDMQAKVRVNQIFAEQMPPPPMSIMFEGWRCSINNVKLMSDPTGPLLKCIHYAPMKTFLSMHWSYMPSPQLDAGYFLPLTLVVTPSHDLADRSSEWYYFRFAPFLYPPVSFN